MILSLLGTSESGDSDNRIKVQVKSKLTINSCNCLLLFKKSVFAIDGQMRVPHVEGA